MENDAIDKVDAPVTPVIDTSVDYPSGSAAPLDALAPEQRAAFEADDGQSETVSGGNDREESDPVTSLVLADDKAMVNPTVVVLYASVGSGHRSAAIAVGEALERLRDEETPVFADGSPVPSDMRVEVLDILDFGRIVFDGDKYASSFTGVTRPYYDLTWRYTFTGRALWGGGTLVSHIMYPKFTAYIQRTKPLAVIATHMLGANVAVGARMIAQQSFPIVNVPTDYETEGMWPHSYADAFCVATEAMAETLRARRIPEERIRLTGIPVRQNFVKRYNKDTVRKTMGLPRDKTLILALAGAYLPQPYVRFREILDEALPALNAHPNMHLVVVAGRDGEYADKLRQICMDYGLENVLVLDFVENMAQLMAASDLIICKSGGLTVTECLCAQVPMVLLGRAYGQERANVNMLTSNGAAMHVTTARELMDALNQISERPNRVKAMLINARALRRPHAASDVAIEALRLSRVPSDVERARRVKHFFKFYWGHKPAHIR